MCFMMYFFSGLLLSPRSFLPGFLPLSYSLPEIVPLIRGGKGNNFFYPAKTFCVYFFKPLLKKSASLPILTLTFLQSSLSLTFTPVSIFFSESLRHPFKEPFVCLFAAAKVIPFFDSPKILTHFFYLLKLQLLSL